MSNKMTVEEKKKAEKLLLDEIEEAERRFKRGRDRQYEVLKEGLETAPTKDVIALHKQYREAKTQAETTEKKLDKLGYEMQGYNGLRLEAKYVHPQLLKFNEETDKGMERFTQVQKKFIVRIYSEGGEMETLLTALSDELKKLVS